MRACAGARASGANRAGDRRINKRATMGEHTAISWTDHTFIPWKGCTKVSPGCDHCYAEADQKRYGNGVRWGAGEPRIHTTPDYWRKPFTWNGKAARTGHRPRIFCSS
jgi:protein gp37